MTGHASGRTLATITLALVLAGCGGGSGGGPGGIFSGILGGGPGAPDADEVSNLTATGERPSTIFDLFNNSDDPNITLRVNRYIWNASLDVLDFLPVETVDPFSGVISTGYGQPPGGGRAYRATIYVQDPALDARSLRVALESRGGGPVSLETTRAVEDAILTRARQLRIADRRL